MNKEDAPTWEDSVKAIRERTAKKMSFMFKLARGASKSVADSKEEA